MARNEPVVGAQKMICPSVWGVRSWNHGAYSPKAGQWYTNAQASCNVVEVGPHAAKDVVFSPPDFAFVELKFVPPPSGKPSSRLQAVDPLTGKTAWQIDAPTPNLGAVLATAGSLVFQRRR